MTVDTSTERVKDIANKWDALFDDNQVSTLLRALSRERDILAARVEQAETKLYQVLDRTRD